MAWTQADIDALKAAIASGRLRVTMGDRDVQFRSLAEMKEILAMMQEEVDATAGTNTRYRTIRVRSGTGL